MRIAVCYNQTPEKIRRGEARDLIADAGSADEANAVLQALLALGHQAELLPLVDDLADFIRRLGDYGPELVFNLCEGFWGDARQEMNVAGVFEMLGIPFTGSSALVLGLTQDKVLTKSLLKQKGLSTPAYVLVGLDETAPTFENLKFPLIVKPAHEDASQGIEHQSVVENRRALLRRVKYVHQTYRQPALVEEYIEGRELNVTVLGHSKPKVLPISEILFDPSLPRAMVCFDSKWSPESAAYKGTRPQCPAELSAREQLLVNLVAMHAFKLLGCRDYARVDIRLRNFSAYILEINANPDISPEAGVARSAAAEGLSYVQLIERILKSASKRKEVSHANPEKK